MTSNRAFEIKTEHRQLAWLALPTTLAEAASLALNLSERLPGELVIVNDERETTVIGRDLPAVIYRNGGLYYKKPSDKAIARDETSPNGRWD